MAKAKRLTTQQINAYMGERIKAARVGARLTQPELGQLIGHSKVYVSIVEHGRSGVKAVDLMRIAEVTRKTVQWFFPV